MADELPLSHVSKEAVGEIKEIRVDKIRELILWALT